MTNVKKVKISEVIAPAFQEFWKASAAGHYTKYVLKGGRASGKSYTIPIRIVSDIVEYPVSALVVRQVQDTLADSVFENFREATRILGVEHLFRFVPSKLEIEYLPRRVYHDDGRMEMGNRILFKGADKKGAKIKSIKQSKFPISHLFFEELAEFEDSETVTTIELSVLRADLDVPSDYRKGRKASYKIFYAYNPPESKYHWLNERYEFSEIGPETYVHHSTYLDNPYLGKQFIQEAKMTEKLNERKYRHVYLGEPIGSALVPFPNLQVKPGIIPDALVQTFDKLRKGLDFGFSGDALVYGEWYYDKDLQAIFAVDEIAGIGLRDSMLATLLKEGGHDQDGVIWADSASSDRIASLRHDYGIRNIHPVAKKKVNGKNSVEAGLEWLANLTAIVIDPQRTPHIADEFSKAVFLKDSKDRSTGVIDPRYDNAPDSTRYAFSIDIHNEGTRVENVTD